MGQQVAQLHDIYDDDVDDDDTVVMSVRPSALTGAAPNGWIFVKFYVIPTIVISSLDSVWSTGHP
jgi:hypothetical protein